MRDFTLQLSALMLIPLSGVALGDIPRLGDHIRHRCDYLTGPQRV